MTLPSYKNAYSSIISKKRPIHGVLTYLYDYDCWKALVVEIEFLLQ
jgi:hypothetical protein